MKLTTEKLPSPIGEVTWVKITADNGAVIVLSSLGAGIVAVKLPDANGKLTDVVLGYPDAVSYIGDGPCAGKTPGRYANRIAKGHFTLDGHEYTLPINNGPNSLHGGPDGFMNRIWNTTVDGDNRVVFTLDSPDGDAGYPGNLKAMTVYTIGMDGSVQIDYYATTDKATVINLTNHTYFNLDGHNTGSCLDHELKMACSKWLPTDDTLIPSGEIASVKGTPMDFTQDHKLGERIKEKFDALIFGKGYDNCWMVDDWDGSLKEVATLKAPKSGRKLTVKTTQPAAQVYTGNWLDGCPTGKDGYTYKDYDAVAIECQGCPDAPNHSNFPCQVLLPGQEYHQTIKFEFE